MDLAEENHVKEITKLATRLLIICLVAGLALAGTYMFTNPRIQQHEADANKQAYESLFPGIASFEEVQFDGQYKSVSKIVRIKDKDGIVIGYNVALTAKGYKGGIALNVGFTPDGKVVGVRVGSNSETVGLGSRVGEPAYYGQYAGLTTPLTLGKDIVAISGATVSSLGVLTGVNFAAQVFSTLSK
jgi:electron transport complex protein RnfG